MPGGRNKGSKKTGRAVQQKIDAGMDLIFKYVYRREPSKAEIRAAMPTYDESMVRRIPPHVKGQRRPKER